MVPAGLAGWAPSVGLGAGAIIPITQTFMAPIDQYNSDLVQSSGPYPTTNGIGAGYYGGTQQGCTMEQLNKHPVTDTFAMMAGASSGDGSGNAGNGAGSFYTCKSSWTLVNATYEGAPSGYTPYAGFNKTNGAGPTSFDFSGAGNPAPPAALTGFSSISNFRSDHPGSGLFLMCDGSVQSINENISMPIYAALSTIAGGESVSGNVGDSQL
jgi:hypothetical protein